MSFLNKIKQAVGVGTVKVELDVPDPLDAKSGKVQGRVILTAESALVVKSVKVKLTEKYTSGRGEDRSTTKSELGSTGTGKPFHLEAGKPTPIPFILQFKLGRFSNYVVSQPQDVLGSVGKLLTKINDDQVEHELVAEVDVQGSALNVKERQRVRFA